MSYYTMLSIYGRCTRQFKIGSKLRFFFAKDRMAPEANRFNSFLRILRKCNFFGKKTNKQKSHKSLFESLSKNAWKYMELKYLDQLRKKTSVVSSWLRSHSPSHSVIRWFCTAHLLLRITRWLLWKRASAVTLLKWSWLKRNAIGIFACGCFLPRADSMCWECAKRKQYAGCGVRLPHREPRWWMF